MCYNVSGPGLNVDSACVVAVVVRVEQVLQGFLLDDDAYLLDASVEVAEVKLAGVVYVEEFERFDQESFLTGKRARFKSDFHL